jgi:hypothetical protein
MNSPSWVFARIFGYEKRRQAMRHRQRCAHLCARRAQRPAPATMRFTATARISNKSFNNQYIKTKRWSLFFSRPRVVCGGNEGDSWAGVPTPRPVILVRSVIGGTFTAAPCACEGRPHASAHAHARTQRAEFFV